VRTPTPIFRGTVEKGRICLDYPGTFKALLARLEGKQIALRVTKHHHSRSLNQNAYYWGIVIPLLAESCGYEDEEMHDALKHRFLRDRANEKGGLVLVRSSAALNTAEFTEYIEQIRRLAAEMGVAIPDPAAVE
jgi:hypothetical protein